MQGRGERWWLQGWPYGEAAGLLAKIALSPGVQGPVPAMGGGQRRGPDTLLTPPGACST